MTVPAPPKPPARPQADSRDARLKAALKANLARRKAQARDRDLATGEAGSDNDNGQDEG
jgi:hypothetical protein